MNAPDPGLTDLIAAHTLRVVELNEAVRYPECNGCDWVGGLVKDHASHVAEVLAASYIIIELPKQDGTGRWKSRRGNKDDGYISWSVGVNGGIPHVRAHRGTGDVSRAVADHIAFAAAILAAAAVASEVSS